MLIVLSTNVVFTLEVGEEKTDVRSSEEAIILVEASASRSWNLWTRQVRDTAKLKEAGHKNAVTCYSKSRRRRAGR